MFEKGHLRISSVSELCQRIQSTPFHLSRLRSACHALDWPPILARTRWQSMCSCAAPPYLNRSEQREQRFHSPSLCFLCFLCLLLLIRGAWPQFRAISQQVQQGGVRQPYRFRVNTLRHYERIYEHMVERRIAQDRRG